MYEVLSSYSTFSLTVFRRQPLDCFFLKSVLPGMQILRFTEASRVCVSDLTQGLWSAFMIISTNSCCNFAYRSCLYKKGLASCCQMPQVPHSTQGRYHEGKRKQIIHLLFQFLFSCTRLCSTSMILQSH